MDIVQTYLEIVNIVDEYFVSSRTYFIKQSKMNKVKKHLEVKIMKNQQFYKKKTSRVKVHQVGG